MAALARPQPSPKGASEDTGECAAVAEGVAHRRMGEVTWQ